MKKPMEAAAALATLAACVAVIALPFCLQHAAVAEPARTRVITLTAVAAQGVWTEEEVNGTNYWCKKFAPAAITVSTGETVILRLISADVEHAMSFPELGIEPVEVKPGQVSELVFHTDTAGRYIFLCATKCGHCHDAMSGTILVLNDGDTPGMYPDPLADIEPCMMMNEGDSIGSYAR